MGGSGDNNNNNNNNNHTSTMDSKSKKRNYKSWTKFENYTMKMAIAAFGCLYKNILPIFPDRTASQVIIISLHYYFFKKIL
jgi:hypothetical protein